MVRSSTSAALAFAATAAAINQPPPVPSNAQIGELAFPVTCQIYGFISQTFDTVFTATAPVYGGSGQEIYYTDVVGTIDVPSYITSLAPLINAKQASANVTVNLDLDNASPATFQAFSGTLNNITFPFGEDAKIRVPAGNGTLPPIGPVTLGTAGVPHRIHLGQVTVSIELQKEDGSNAFGPIPVTCGQQNIDYIIGSVDVDTSSGPPYAPSNGFVPAFPPTPNLYESGAFRFPYDCNFGPLGDYTLDLEIAGTIPAYFAPGSQFSLSNAQSFLRVPDSLSSLAVSAFPDAKTFETTVTEFDILFDNAQPATYNVAKTPIHASSPISGSDVIIAIPETGSLNVGPITAGKDGQIVAVAVGSANASVAIADASGNALLTLPVTCKVMSPLELIGVPITSQIPDDYALGIKQKSSSSATSSSAGFSLPTIKARDSTCFDDGDCFFAGGKCIKASGQITGTCQKTASATLATATSAASATPTDATCFDDGDCILSGGKCAKASGQITG
ncbi:hypothetical protein PRZ48_005273 [Zasmidium cellare]|uniref:Uncharacterized protein n=1 Tax=Zasmidium cellare TaxID=395010 RepID=A0ABR0ES63_ZASCE|nr:hypothetical protein PRZ48_005273 [Zasmidium cellare]